MVKGKFPMYKNYFKYDSVYRLEFEFLNHFCAGFTFDKINDLLEYIEKFLDLDKSI